MLVALQLSMLVTPPSIKIRGVFGHMGVFWCKENFTVFWLKEFWLPTKPDLNLMDFEVWSALEHKACATSHKNIDALKHSLEKSWNKISPETLHATCSQVIHRLQCMIRAKGDYFK